ncbi:MAG TPA: ABC transporter permease subunit [Acidimicrobiales bacterium]|nr:ABC transporter permease subunit [Acidimicrobiales bacterium]
MAIAGQGGDFGQGGLGQGTTGISEGLDLYGRPAWYRSVGNWLGWGGCIAAVLLIAAPIISVLWGIIARAVPTWQWSVLTESTTAAGGGLYQEILGTLELVAGVGILAGVVGVLSGVYLAEYASGALGSLLRGASEVLAGVPSIVLGYVGYLALVVALHWKFSLAAALMVLSALTVPYIAKSTETALRAVPTSYREGADGLGMSPLRSLTRITMKAALPGITTGWLVALAISVGETAPLLYTAGTFTSDGPTAHLTGVPVSYLTFMVWNGWNSSFSGQKELSYDASLVLVVLVLLLIIGSRLIVSFTQRHTEKN